MICNPCTGQVTIFRMSYVYDIIYFLYNITCTLEGSDLGKMVTLNQHGGISPFFQVAGLRHVKAWPWWTLVFPGHNGRLIFYHRRQVICGIWGRGNKIKKSRGRRRNPWTSSAWLWDCGRLNDLPNRFTCHRSASIEKRFSGRWWFSHQRPQKPTRGR